MVAFFFEYLEPCTPNWAYGKRSSWIQIQYTTSFCGSNSQMILGRNMNMSGGAADSPLEL